MSNQSEINNNTVEVSWRSEEGLQAKCGSNKENGALLENGGTSLEIAGSVIEQQAVFGDGDHDQDGASNGSEEDGNNRLEVEARRLRARYYSPLPGIYTYTFGSTHLEVDGKENNRLEVDGKVGELKAEGVEAKDDEILALKRDAADADYCGTEEESKEARAEGLKVNFIEDFEGPPVGGKAREVEVTDDSSSEMNSVMEFSGSALKTRDESVDEVSRLLAALRALCSSANTDVVLLCGAWQMRAHSEVLRARSHALSEMLGISDGQLGRTIKLRLNMDPGALGIAVNYMYFNEVR